MTRGANVKNELWHLYCGSLPRLPDGLFDDLDQSFPDLIIFALKARP